MSAFDVQWLDHRRQSQLPPNPDYPEGIDLDCSSPPCPSCRVELPYPAKRCGVYLMTCRRCGLTAGCTTGGESRRSAQRDRHL